jgi:hypothetical protein
MDEFIELLLRMLIFFFRRTNVKKDFFFTYYDYIILIFYKLMFVINYYCDTVSFTILIPYLGYLCLMHPAELLFMFLVAVKGNSKSLNLFLSNQIFYLNFNYFIEGLDEIKIDGYSIPQVVLVKLLYILDPLLLGKYFNIVNT